MPGLSFPANGQRLITFIGNLHVPYKHRFLIIIMTSCEAALGSVSHCNDFIPDFVLMSLFVHFSVSASPSKSRHSLFSD